MTIPFKNIPQNLRVPLFYAELDNSRANTGASTLRALIIGQITADGTATPGVPRISQGPTDSKQVGGLGSMLASMTDAYRQGDSFGELWYLPLADDDNAVASTGTIGITAPPTATGVISLYIAGVLTSLRVSSAMETADVATALADAINANLDLPVTAEVGAAAVDDPGNGGGGGTRAADPSATVTLTAKNAGLAGNGIDVQLNYRGSASGEALPTGMAVEITPMAGGQLNPDITDALANLSDDEYDFIAVPYTDAANLDAMKAFLSSTTGRWSWSEQIYGGGYAAYEGTLGDLTTFGTTRNDEHMSVTGFNGSPTPPWQWAAALTAAVAVSARADPALPLQTVTLPAILPPPPELRFTLSERNVLLWDGVSTFSVAQDGTVAIENQITTYQVNSFGMPDDSYLQVETLNTIAYVLRALKADVTSKYARVKLAADGTRFAPGSAIVTPSIIRAGQIATYQELEYNGYVQQSDVFAEAIIVEINATNPNRVDVLYPAVLINQLRIFALLFQFTLQ
jgi:phage tail sheath gpL-like